MKINPQRKVESIKKAKDLVGEGIELAQKGEVKAAVEKFKTAQEFDKNIDLNPETEELDKNPQAVAEKLAAPSLITQGKELVRDGKVKEAIAAYNKALKINPDLQISADDWDTLCWHGAINKHAQDVMDACEEAVNLEPENGSFKRSRGVARALTGDYKGAAEDFEFFVKRTKDDKAKSRNQGYVNDLKKCKNPFTPKRLEELRQ